MLGMIVHDPEDRDVRTAVPSECIRQYTDAVTNANKSIRAHSISGSS